MLARLLHTVAVALQYIYYGSDERLDLARLH
jgi:hypothetical protein